MEAPWATLMQPEYVRLLTKDFSLRVLNNSEFFFCPPLSKVERGVRAVTDYVWRAGVDRDIKNTGRLTRTLLTECESKQALRATQSMMRNHCVEEADLHANEASQQGPGRGRYHFGRSLLCHHIDQSSKTCVGAPLMDKV